MSENHDFMFITLKNIQTMMSDDRPFKCKKCDMRFDSQKRLEIHSKTHASRRPTRNKQERADFERPDFSHVM